MSMCAHVDVSEGSFVANYPKLSFVLVFNFPSRAKN